MLGPALNTQCGWSNQILVTTFEEVAITGFLQARKPVYSSQFRCQEAETCGFLSKDQQRGLGISEIIRRGWKSKILPGMIPNMKLQNWIADSIARKVGNPSSTTGSTNVSSILRSHNQCWLQSCISSPSTPCLSSHIQAHLPSRTWRYKATGPYHFFNFEAQKGTASQKGQMMLTEPVYRSTSPRPHWRWWNQDLKPSCLAAKSKLYKLPFLSWPWTHAWYTAGSCARTIEGGL